MQEDPRQAGQATRTKEPQPRPAVRIAEARRKADRRAVPAPESPSARGPEIEAVATDALKGRPDRAPLRDAPLRRTSSAFFSALSRSSSSLRFFACSRMRACVHH
jgi:hypothetical protein